MAYINSDKDKNEDGYVLPSVESSSLTVTTHLIQGSVHLLTAGSKQNCTKTYTVFLLLKLNILSHGVIEDKNVTSHSTAKQA